MYRSIVILSIIILFLNGCSGGEGPLSTTEEGRVIVLLYHRITEGEATNLYERSVEDFESDLIFLINNKINVIDFHDLMKIRDSGKMPAGHSAIITFDDGDCSWYLTAMPLLRKYRFKATFFLWTNMIGRESFLEWSEVEYMSNIMYPGGIRPFSFGSHSFSHPYLHERKYSYENPDQYNSFLDYELGVSKGMIETYVPVEIDILALPFGDGAGDPDIIAATVRNGYDMIRTSINGAIVSADFDQYLIPCLPVLDQTEPEEIGYFLFN